MEVFGELEASVPQVPDASSQMNPDAKLFVPPK